MIRFRFDPLEGLATKLDKAAARGRYALAAVQAVNEVTQRAEGSLIRGEIRDINLTPAYVRSKTDLALAQPGGKARAVITTKGDLTVMGNFSPLRMVPGYGAQRRAGPRKGLRNAGVHVAIRKAAPMFDPQWFVLPLRRGAAAGGNGFGVFVRDDRYKPSPKATREGKAGKRHIYGPSPYALFREQIRVQETSIETDLRLTALARMGRELEDALA